MRYAPTLLFCIMMACGGGDGIEPSTYTVDSTADTPDALPGDDICLTADSVCTLRAAIEEVNAHRGRDTIAFGIAGAGPHTISPATALPDLTGTATIDGTTQLHSDCGALWDGDVPTWSILIDGNGAAFDGLTIAGTATIKGLAIEGFRNGIVLTTGGNTVQCTRLHGQASDDSAHGNGLVIDGAGNTIGGAADGGGNLISGNTGVGIWVSSGDANVIRGNFIGTNATGDASDPNDCGIAITAGKGTTVGGTVSGAGNLLSGNTGAFQSDHVDDLAIGMYIDEAALDVVIQGNIFGADHTGTTALFTGPDRVSKELVTKGDGTIVGGTAAGARNLIVPLHTGVTTLAEADATIIQGNYFGLNAAGTAVIAPAVVDNADGIHDGGTDTQVGGTESGAGNVFAGFHDGTCIEKNAGTGLLVQGNIFGADPSGNGGDSTFDNGSGVFLLFVDGNTIGGATPAARNIMGRSTIRTQGAAAIVILGGADNVVQGNYLGVGADGTTSLANGHGVLILGSTSANNMIGGKKAGEGNVIANNTGTGVTVGDIGYGVGDGNQVLRNTIYDNGGLGIDLSLSGLEDGVTDNDDGDTDGGPNGLQNTPVLSTATTNGSSTTVAGTLNSLASAAYRIEFFANASGDGSAHGEGQTYLGAIDVTTDRSGDARFEVSGLAPTAPGDEVSATASEDLGGGQYTTSEFSENVEVLVR